MISNASEVSNDLNLPLIEVIAQENRHATIVAGGDGFRQWVTGTSCILNGSWTRRAGEVLAHNLFKELVQVRGGRTVKLFLPLDLHISI